MLSTQLFVFVLSSKTKKVGHGVIAMWRSPCCLASKSVNTPEARNLSKAIKAVQTIQMDVKKQITALKIVQNHQKAICTIMCLKYKKQSHSLKAFLKRIVSHPHSTTVHWPRNTWAPSLCPGGRMAHTGFCEETLTVNLITNYTTHLATPGPLLSLQMCRFVRQNSSTYKIVPSL